MFLEPVDEFQKYINFKSIQTQNNLGHEDNLQPNCGIYRQ